MVDKPNNPNNRRLPAFTFRRALLLMASPTLTLCSRSSPSLPVIFRVSGFQVYSGRLSFYL